MFKLKEKIILASGSPRRKELLSLAGIEFEIVLSDIEEDVLDKESPESLVSRLALAKAVSVSQKHPGRWILAADTTVSVGDVILNKPLDYADCVSMLSQLSGTKHQVWGGIGLVNSDKKVSLVRTSMTDVFMKKLSASQIDSYARMTEPYDKAGGYGIQETGGLFVQKIEGSYHNVVGLNMCMAIQMLEDNGLLDL